MKTTTPSRPLNPDSPLDYDHAFEFSIAAAKMNSQRYRCENCRCFTDTLLSVGKMVWCRTCLTKRLVLLEEQYGEPLVAKSARRRWVHDMEEPE